MNLSSRVLLSSISIISRKKLSPSFCTEGKRKGKREEVPLSFRVVDIHAIPHDSRTSRGGPFKSRYGNHWLVNSLSAINSRCDWFTRGWESDRRRENSTNAKNTLSLFYLIKKYVQLDEILKIFVSKDIFVI